MDTKGIIVLLTYVTFMMSTADSQINGERCLAGYYLHENECERCERGSFNSVNNHTRGSCELCPPHNVTGQAASTLYIGATSHTDCFFEPKIDTFHPTKGPKSGGTVIQVKLFAFEDFYDVVVAYAARTPANITAFNKSEATVTLLTRRVDEKKQGVIQLTFSIDKLYKSDASFSYQEDPVIDSISKLKTFISGGLSIIVHGSYLDNVDKPQMLIAMVYRRRVTTVYSPCVVDPASEGTSMECKTPDLKPALHENSVRYDGRRKRAVTAPTLNDKDKQFYGGFVLDGVMDYRNITEVWPEHGEFEVYLDPEYFPFEEEDYMKYFNPVDKFLNIRGERLNYACDENDVLVRIGVEYCNVTILTANMLTCVPPSTQPEPDPLGYGPGKTPRVTVYVGNLDFFIGYLKYGPKPEASTNEDESDDIMFAILGGAIGLGLLLIVIIIILVVIVRHKRKRKSPRAHLEARLAENGSASWQGRYVPHGTLQNELLYTQVAGDGSGSSNMAFLADDNNNGPPRQRGRQMSETVSAPPTPDAHGEARTRGSLDIYFSKPAEESPENVMEALEESLRLSVNECLISHEHVTVGDVIGTGYFGKVYKATLKSKEKEDESENVVAIKTIQGTHHTIKEVGAFLEEAVVMKDFEHENVLSLIGVAMNGRQPLVILPYMAHGDLKLYIREPSRMMKVKELLGFGKQIARGMTYLSKQKFVHRDLATRNCMLNDSLVVKIADFGLSRDVYKTDYYRVEDKHRPLPVRWMAVESLTSGVFSTKSDVWSFGVCLWELLTRGCSPYPDVDTFNIKQYVCSGRRLSQPEHTPDDVFELLEKCWLENPNERPDFTEVHDALENILDTSNSDYATLVLPS